MQITKTPTKYNPKLLRLDFSFQPSEYILKSANWLWSVSGTVNAKNFDSHLHLVGIKEYSCNYEIGAVQPHLKLDLTMTLTKTERNSNIQKHIDPTVQYKNIISNNKHILDESKYSDYTFIVQGTVYKVHKNILAASSPVFDKLFATKFTESLTNECHVTDIEPIIFQYLLSFIYCGKLPERLHEENVSRKLFKAAHYYQITELVNTCTSVEHYKLCKENAVEMFEWADTYNLERVKLDAWKIIQL